MFFVKLRRVYNVQNIINEGLFDDLIDQVGPFEGRRSVYLNEMAPSISVDHDVVAEELEGCREGWD